MRGEGLDLSNFVEQKLFVLRSVFFESVLRVLADDVSNQMYLL